MISAKTFLVICALGNMFSGRSSTPCSQSGRGQTCPGAAFQELYRDKLITVLVPCQMHLAEPATIKLTDLWGANGTLSSYERGISRKIARREVARTQT